MDYDNIDETTMRQEACRKVKQIADAIKKIRIKYYPNFSAISETDKSIYDELYQHIEKVASENGLHKLKAELINDITDRYDSKIPSLDNDNQAQNDKFDSDKILKAYYGAIDAEKQALSEGKLKRAMNCQGQANELMKRLKDNAELVDMAIYYKREKLAELTQTKQKTTNWDKVLENYYMQGKAKEREAITQEIRQQTQKEPQIETNEYVME